MDSAAAGNIGQCALRLHPETPNSISLPFVAIENRIMGELRSNKAAASVRLKIFKEHPLKTFR